MSETYTLNILYKGVQHEITCMLRVSAYTYQFICTTGDSGIILDKDDEGNWRAMDADPFSGKKNKPEPGLVKSLIDELDRILK